MPVTKTIVPSTTLPPADQLDPGDLAFHQFVLAQIDRLPALQAEIAAITGGRDLWSAYLKQKYGDGQDLAVSRDGSISRAPVVNSTGG